MGAWSRKWDRRFDAAIAVAVISTLIAVGWYAWTKLLRDHRPAPGPSGLPLVVYCAHDSVYAAAILRSFEEQTGIRVEPRYDTEATKSLGLVNLILAEREHPRCDVFWNNEPLAMMQLRREGALLPYKGPGYNRIPDRFKDPEGYWTGFAARLRVQAVNKKFPLIFDSPPDLTERDDLSRFAIAKPLYGTTLMHYSVLWKEWGGERVKAWHREVRRRGAREVAGNGPAMDLVASGECDFCWTDTDDYFAARDAGKQVDMIPSLPPILIPNATAIIYGTKRLEDSQRLIDFLLSAETELALAKSKSRQVPLGPTEGKELPPEVRALQIYAETPLDLFKLDAPRTECLEWLKSEYLR